MFAAVGILTQSACECHNRGFIDWMYSFGYYYYEKNNNTLKLRRKLSVTMCLRTGIYDS